MAQAKERINAEALGAAVNIWGRLRIAWRVLWGKHEQDVRVLQGMEWPAKSAVRVRVFAKMENMRGDLVLEEAHGVTIPLNICVTNVSPFPITLTRVNLNVSASVSVGIAEALVDAPTTYINIAPGAECVWSSKVIAHVSQSSMTASGACSHVEARGYVIVEGPWSTFEDKKEFTSAVWMPLMRVDNRRAHTSAEEPPALGLND